MKFTRYLEDTQTPEWKRAYIDYRVFKERIRAISRAHEEGQLYTYDSDSNSQINPRGSSLSVIVQSESGHNSPGRSSVHLPLENPTFRVTSRSRSRGRGDAPDSPDNNTPPPSPSGGPAASTRGRKPKTTLPRLVVQQPTNHSYRAAPSPLGEVTTLNSQNSRRNIVRTRPQIERRTTSNTLRELVPPSPAVPPVTPVSRVVRNFANFIYSSRRHPYSELSLNALLPQLSPQELAFFSALDSEMQKVEKFYSDREAAMKKRTKDLEAQLRELNEQRKLFDAAHPSSSSWSTILDPRWIFTALKTKFLPPAYKEKPTDIPRISIEDVSSAAKKDDQKMETGHLNEHLDRRAYLNAKRKLKKAVVEHFHGLEMLNNYRILNIYGFRRVLQKFEKATKISAQRAYMSERMEKCSFFADETLRAMMVAMQDIFADSFTEGDKQRAITRLHAEPRYKSHHNSTFWSGIALGSAVVALGSGIFHSYNSGTRQAIPGWDGLLFIYGVLAVPVIFALIIGLNLLAWARARVNYPFIFELDLRTRLDHREYYQIPSFLFATLCYALWLSFARIGAPRVSPTIWPLVWLGLAAVLMLWPFPVLFKPSRYWLLKNVGKLLRSGLQRVEFTDFWMGDQFCSFVFTLSNLTLIGCVYSRNLDAEWRQCGSVSKLWPLSFILGVLPFIARLIQSFKRYADSKLTTHLINAGKYGTGIISYLCYFIWRHRGSHYDQPFAFWCLFNAIYTIYALTWDFLMDWSILRLHSQHFLLRQELVYTNHIFLYYIAIATNTMIRFMWILYIPAKGPDVMLRTFIVGLLEIVRRWVWNFYRLENEHLGNVDQYRVTREVPLPYSLDVQGDLEDEAEETEGHPETKPFAFQRVLSRT